MTYEEYIEFLKEVFKLMGGEPPPRPRPPVKMPNIKL